MSSGGDTAARPADDTTGTSRRSARELIGHEATPVLVVDGVSEFTAGLQQAASLAAFEPDSASMYPGLRAKMPREVAITILQGVYQQLYPVYQIPSHLRLHPKQASFSLLTSAPHELRPMQCIPHFDTSRRYFFALLLYLNPGHHGSTGFFRHTPTGYERVGDERVDAYFAAADRFNAAHGAPAQGYQVASGGQYELYHQIDYRQHRMAIYPGNLLHSILVDPATDIEQSPTRGRLTANIFFEFC